MAYQSSEHSISLYKNLKKKVKKAMALKESGCIYCHLFSDYMEKIPSLKINLKCHFFHMVFPTLTFLNYRLGTHE